MSGARGTALRGAIAAERIRLVAGRSTWWCLAMSGAFALGVAALAVRFPAEEGEATTVVDVVSGVTFGQLVLLVLGVLSMTSEHGFGTVRPAFQAIPSRWQVVAAKAAVLGVAGGVVGSVFGFAAYGLAVALAPSGLDLSLDAAAEWRQVAAVGLVYAITAVIGVAVGAVVRSGAVAVGGALIWVLLGESVVGLIPRVGDSVGPWMPFNVLLTLIDAAGIDTPMGVVGGAVYCVAVAAVLLTLAMTLVRRRAL
ncbi:ABC-2 type transport system permease protein [Actinomadura pelletieri DSM 43383]|uniref:ABC-2 type transport system permease protein n=1 Tax=Actinomadura pelletieri DSM 43383 TaxID=1120940 RepID=A0A495QA53_9ACTN|nr:hypothetical protein [Actinomadura pelletieri]RKS68379.1 ABC-2 type transport system permease protein [Actinomadura pelletieri DSM 43383]